MTFYRNIEPKFLQQLRQYPIVTVLGPRQSGKTTLVKHLCKNIPYLNLEEPDIRELADRDPRAILNKYPDGLIIDEIQHVPALLSYIQAIVDEKQRDGMYILTGSHQIELHAALTQSLAGRTALLQLFPLSLSELKKANISCSTNQLMLNGFYPRIYNKKLNPTEVYRDYVKTYLERDVRSMVNVKDLLQFQRFMKLCAARTATVLNVDNIANDVGVSGHTIKHWLSILQASYLVELIPPYFENFGKQAVKSPKLYFTDVGLVAYLLEIESLSQIDRDPLRGNLFETMVVMELMKTRTNQGREPHLYFYRDSMKQEVDIIYKKGAELIAVEIKSAETFNQNFLKGLTWFKNMAGERCQQAYLIYNGTMEFEQNGICVMNYIKTAEVIGNIER